MGDTAMTNLDLSLDNDEEYNKLYSKWASRAKSSSSMAEKLAGAGLPSAAGLNNSHYDPDPTTMAALSAKEQEAFSQMEASNRVPQLEDAPPEPMFGTASVEQ